MKKLTLNQLLAIAELGELSHDEIAEQTGIPENMVKRAVSSEPSAYIREFWSAYAEHGPNMEKLRDALLVGGDMSPSATRRKKLTGNRFVFTSAQNNTPVHKPFLNALLNYCERNDAQLIVGQYVYNKNGFQNGVLESEDIYYADELKPFLLSESRTVCNGLVWCGELNILPTAKFPLSGLEQYTGAASSIVPQAKIALESIPTAKHLPAKMLYATGTVTQHNYIQKKTGQLAESGHCYGALIVEVNHGQWYARQVQTGDNGSFQDWKTIYNSDGTVTPGKITAINWGDIHAEKTDDSVLLSCIDLAKELTPKYQILHDLFDMESRNHHNRNNPHFLYRTFCNQQSVADDLEKTRQVLFELSNACDDSALVVVESNHDLALERWLSDPAYDFRKDPVNAGIYLELQNWVYNVKDGVTDGLLEYALHNPSATFLATDESFTLHGIEFGYHGHVGANGSRGNPKQFTRLNMPMNTGHTHSASIHGQVYTAGVTGSLEMSYNVGPSSWSHSHILTYGTGYRTIVTLNGVKYRA